MKLRNQQLPPPDLLLPTKVKMWSGAWTSMTAPPLSACRLSWARRTRQRCDTTKLFGGDDTQRTCRFSHAVLLCPGYFSGFVDDNATGSCDRCMCEETLVFVQQARLSVWFATLFLSRVTCLPSLLRFSVLTWKGICLHCKTPHDTTNECKSCRRTFIDYFSFEIPVRIFPCCQSCYPGRRACPASFPCWDVHRVCVLFDLRVKTCVFGHLRRLQSDVTLTVHGPLLHLSACRLSRLAKKNTKRKICRRRARWN